jgi:hypothetical protein
MDVVYYEDATMEDVMEFLGAEKEEERDAVRRARKVRNRQSAQRSRQARYLRMVSLRNENEELERMAALVAIFSGRHWRGEKDDVICTCDVNTAPDI